MLCPAQSGEALETHEVGGTKDWYNVLALPSAPAVMHESISMHESERPKWHSLHEPPALAEQKVTCQEEDLFSFASRTMQCKRGMVGSSQGFWCRLGATCMEWKNYVLGSYACPYGLLKDLIKATSAVQA